MSRAPAGTRPRQILEALARELEEHPGTRVTTARLAGVVGISEAALYRHFSGKAQMFEALIEFAEETVFHAVARALQEQPGAPERCAQIATIVLTFAERNPGICRLLLGEALVGEEPALRTRVAHFFERLETQLRQLLREGAASVTGPGPRVDVNASAALLSAVLEGRLRQFSREGARRKPTDGWGGQWRLLRAAIFGEAAGSAVARP